MSTSRSHFLFRKKVGIAVTVAIIASIFVAHVYLYKTWGNNEHYYVTSERLVTFCDMVPFQQPRNCVSVGIDEWCRGEGGLWNASARECNGVSGLSCWNVLGTSYSGQTCYVPVRHMVEDPPWRGKAGSVAGGADAGPPGPSGEDGCACDIDVAGGGAYVELLKQGDDYRSMGREQRDAYVAMAIDFITPENAYECARNALLVESAEIALEMGAASDSRRAGELAAEYGAVMQKLEEYGIGPQGKTEADPDRYFEKYGRAMERLGGQDGCGGAGGRAEDGGMVGQEEGIENVAGGEGGAAGYPLAPPPAP